MLYKDLVTACMKHASEEGPFKDLQAELDRIHKTVVDNSEIKIMSLEVYNLLLDKALQLELLLLKGTVDIIIQKSFSDDDRKRVLDTINYVKLSSNPNLFNYIRSC